MAAGGGRRGGRHRRLTTTSNDRRPPENPLSEILPNLHPIFVHFTVALPLVATLFHLLAWVDEARRPQWLTAGRLDLWLGAAISAAPSPERHHP